MARARGHELLEHTADVGVRAWGPDEAAAIEEAARALVELMGAGCERVRTVRRIEIDDPDPASAAVALLNELIWLRDAEGVGFGEVRVRPGAAGIEAEVEAGPPGGSPPGLDVKAATYHGLRLASDERGAELSVILDV